MTHALCASVIPRSYHACGVGMQGQALHGRLACNASVHVRRTCGLTNNACMLTCKACACAPKEQARNSLQIASLWMGLAWAYYSILALELGHQLTSQWLLFSNVSRTCFFVTIRITCMHVMIIFDHHPNVNMARSSPLNFCFHVKLEQHQIH